MSFWKCEAFDWLYRRPHPPPMHCLGVVLNVWFIQGRCNLKIGRFEKKTMTKFLSHENEVRPGVVMTGVTFFFLQEVN